MQIYTDIRTADASENVTTLPRRFEGGKVLVNAHWSPKYPAIQVIEIVKSNEGVKILTEARK